MSITHNTITYSFSGRKVQNCIKLLPLLIERHPSVRTVIVHAGTCDVMSRQSTKLQQEFERLIFTVENLGRTCIVSGPLPTIRRRNERFSRLFSLDKWLENFCTATGLAYISNFDTFWSKPQLLRLDCILTEKGLSS